MDQFAQIYNWIYQYILGLSPEWMSVWQLTNVVLLVVLALIALASYYINKLILFRILKIIIRKTPGKFDDIFINKKFLRRLGFIIPLVLIHKLIPFTIPFNEGWIGIVKDGCEILLTFFTLTAGYALLDSFYDAYQQIDISKYKPIKGYLQIIKILTGLFAGVFILSIIINQSPGYLLGGLGAMTAVLLLVFKDTILGFVASVQLSSNDMVRPGDWITVEKYKADGTVMEITLSSVKVQNFDNTFVFVPTYAFVSDAFQNWRGMQDSPGRRLKRSVNIDVNSVRFASDEDLVRFGKIKLISSYIAETQKAIEDFNKSIDASPETVINFRRQTNIGIYRAYLTAYLNEHPRVNKKLTCMVRQLAPADNGIPIEAYAFIKDRDWVVYEGIVADIFDHVLAATRFFDLEIFQSTTGTDIRNAVQLLK
ncbi:MAG: hypothetical protein CVU11_10590 [Bacteroidetes bacterium HGW-Bacteroidetes-6]|jgi:miniconductance mechanosensitive channel|nr:MAG: hypothetical protein CVU11_10590 [Bacteroidetes bacterium HGW-Bacteroidetes-6]